MYYFFHVNYWTIWNTVADSDRMMRGANSKRSEKAVLNCPEKPDSNTWSEIIPLWSPMPWFQHYLRLMHYMDVPTHGVEVGTRWSSHPKLFYDKGRSVLGRKIKKILRAVQEKALGIKIYWVRGFFFFPREKSNWPNRSLGWIHNECSHVCVIRITKTRSQKWKGGYTGSGWRTLAYHLPPKTFPRGPAIELHFQGSVHVVFLWLRR